MSRGGGRINLAAVTQITATFSSRGQPSLGLGQFSASKESGTEPVGVTVQSVVSTAVTYSISLVPAVDGANAPTITLSTTTLTVTGNGSGGFTSSFTISPKTAPGDYYGDITLTGGTITLNIPYWITITP